MEQEEQELILAEFKRLCQELVTDDLIQLRKELRRTILDEKGKSK